MNCNFLNGCKDDGVIYTICFKSFVQIKKISICCLLKLLLIYAAAVILVF